MKNKINYTSEIIRQIESLRKHFKTQFTRQCEECGFTLPQLLLLHEVFHTPGITLNEVSEKLLLAKSTVSELVTRLESKELLRRERPENNKRITRLYLNENTLAVDGVLNGIRESCYRPIVENATEDEVVKILDSLKLFNEIIERGTNA